MSRPKKPAGARCIIQPPELVLTNFRTSNSAPPHLTTALQVTAPTLKVAVPQLLSLAALARRLDVSPGKARRLVEEGILTPDLVCGRQLMFAAGRLPLLKAIAEAPLSEIRAIQGRIINSRSPINTYDK